MSDKSDKNHNPKPYEQYYSTADITLAARKFEYEKADRAFAPIHYALCKADLPAALELMHGHVIKDEIISTQTEPDTENNVIDMEAARRAKQARLDVQNAAIPSDDLTGELLSHG